MPWPIPASHCMSVLCESPGRLPGVVVCCGKSPRVSDAKNASHNADIMFSFPVSTVAVFPCDSLAHERQHTGAHKENNWLKER